MWGEWEKNSKDDTPEDHWASLSITLHWGTEGSTNKTTFPIVDTHQKELSGFNPTFVAASKFVFRITKLRATLRTESWRKGRKNDEYESMNQYGLMMSQYD